VKWNLNLGLYSFRKLAVNCKGLYIMVNIHFPFPRLPSAPLRSRQRSKPREPLVSRSLTAACYVLSNLSSSPLRLITMKQDELRLISYLFLHQTQWWPHEIPPSPIGPWSEPQHPNPCLTSSNPIWVGGFLGGFIASKGGCVLKRKPRDKDLTNCKVNQTQRIWKE
jgi:hypothetical protein